MANESFGSRLKHAWNIFLNKDPTYESRNYQTPGSSIRPDRPFLRTGRDRTIISSIYSRIANDVASVNIRHVRVDHNGMYVEDIDSRLNNCLTLEANIDQSYRDFMIDAVLSLFEEGVIAIVPTDVYTDSSPTKSSYDVMSMRTAKIIEWKPRNVRVEVYNESTMMKEQLLLPKSMVAIVENPFYSVMNAPNSTYQRLLRKLSLLDMIDEQNSSGKLDMIIQLPYIVKTEQRMQQAEKRRQQIEDQLTNSKYGIAYTDGTEKITQLNRSLDNNLMAQVEYLTSMLYGQLGMTPEIINGTASQEVMMNYMSRVVEPIVDGFALGMKRKFLTKTARSQRQSIEYFIDPFRFVPVAKLAEIADSFTRNEILTTNEVRSIIGYKPSDDPRANMLINKNIAPGTQEQSGEYNMQGQYQTQEAPPTLDLSGGGTSLNLSGGSTSLSI